MCHMTCKKDFIVFILLAACTTTLLASEFTQHAELEKNILGNWIAAEYYVAQPPTELQQPIKSISFKTNNIAQWQYVKDEKALEAEGRYGIYSFGTDQKPEPPTLIVAPTNYTNPALSSQRLLKLSNLELDFDSRFLQEWGKLIKATGPDNKRLLFIRKQQPLSAATSSELTPSFSGQFDDMFLSQKPLRYQDNVNFLTALRNTRLSPEDLDIVKSKLKAFLSAEPTQRPYAPDSLHTGVASEIAFLRLQALQLLAEIGSTDDAIFIRGLDANAKEEHPLFKDECTKAANKLESR
jgi:hypothetical protein